MRLLLLGCTGFIGRQLVPTLANSNHELTIISRKNNPLPKIKYSNQKLNFLKFDLTKQKSWNDQELINCLSQSDGVINLVGEPIAEKRWTRQHCQKLKDSRLNTTRFLIEAISQLRKPPSILINASAVGYYGTSKNEIFSEESKCGQDFLGKLCEEWEEIALEKPKTTRLVIIRMGIVLGAGGGALGKMVPVFKAGLGGPIGTGEQWISWIQLTDLCQIIEKSLTDKSWSGIFNCVAPKPISMKDFASTLGQCLNRPSIFPVPGAILKVLLGDGARVVLEGQDVRPKRLMQKKFKFKYPELDQALRASTLTEHLPVINSGK